VGRWANEHKHARGGDPGTNRQYYLDVEDTLPGIQKRSTLVPSLSPYNFKPCRSNKDFYVQPRLHRSMTLTCSSGRRLGNSLKKAKPRSLLEEEMEEAQAMARLPQATSLEDAMTAPGLGSGVFFDWIWAVQPAQFQSKEESLK